MNAMIKLNFPEFTFDTSVADGNTEIWDEIRKQYVALTPEEWVRQNLLKFLVSEKKIPAGLISVEHHLYLNRLQKRCDVVVFNRKGLPVMIVECKAPPIKLNQKVFDQISQYNIKLKVPWLLVTNGLTHYCCKIDFERKKYLFLQDIPDFETLITQT